MTEIRNLAGTIMHRNKPLIEFKIEDYVVKFCRPLTKIEECPFEFRSAATIERALKLYLEQRLPPETRIGLQKTLNAVGIPYYDPERIIRFSHGYNVSDKIWIQFNGDNYTFEEIEKRAIHESRTLAEKMALTELKGNNEKKITVQDRHSSK